MATNPFPIERETLNTPMLISPKMVLQGIVAKKEIVNQVIDGRLPLLEAAAKFQIIQRTATACLESVTGMPFQTIDSEQACRTVIGWVALVLSDRPEQADMVSDRLERELQSYLERFGKVHLPPTK
jgi:hypothetical protein